MKKLIAWILVLTLCMGLFAGCQQAQPEVTDPSTEATQPTEGTQPTEPVDESDIEGINDALEYVVTFYRNEGGMTPKDFTRIGTVPMGTKKYEIVWTTTLGEDLVKPVRGEDGMVTIQIVGEVDTDTPYTLTATITDAAGNSVSHDWEHILPATMDVAAILEEAYALEKGAAMGCEVTLTGKIISVDTAYNPDYKNVTVTIEVPGHEDKPIMCYRLKGEGADNIGVNDTITVTGTIKNYNGTIEFDAGCILDEVVKGETIVAPEDPAEILTQAYELPVGKSLPYTVTLTGVITSIDTPYSEQYNNISVVIAVPGSLDKPILCYRLKGAGAESLKPSDTITVTGAIKNYEGTIEFDAGCQLVDVKKGPGYPAPSDPLQILEEAYKLPITCNLLYEAELTGVITAVNSPFSSKYNNISVTIVVEGQTDKPMYCHRMSGAGVDKIGVGDTITVRGTIMHYYDWAKKTGSIQFATPALMDYELADGPYVPTYVPELVEAPAAETAYKLYVDQENLNEIRYFTGNVANSYYLETTFMPEAAMDVYLKAVDGGYNLYFKSGDAVQYINAVPSGNYVNPVPGDTAETVWTYNEEYDTLVTTIDGTDYYMGSYNTFNTLSISKFSYITTSFPSHLGVLVENENTEPEPEPEPQEKTIPEVLAMTGIPAFEVIVEGKVCGTYGDSWGTYGNLYIKDAEGNQLLIYGLYDQDGNRYDAMTTKPDLGDTIKVQGKVSIYQGVPQVKNGTLLAHTEGVADPEPEPEPQEKTIAEVLAMTQAPEYEVIVEGKIAEVYSTKYGNMYIEDAAGNRLNVYGLYTEDNVRYDSMTTKPVAGDTIKVQSKVNIFNESIELKNAVLLSHTPGTTDPDPDPPVSNLPVTFEFPAKGGTGHQDGEALADGAAYTSGDYTLTLTGMSKVYGPAQDAKGNGCIKFGTSSVAGSLTFEVPEDVNYVVIKVTGYKQKTSKLTVNGGDVVVLNKKSDDGQYQEIVIDTTTSKTVTIATVDGATRVMMSAVTYHATEPDVGAVTPDPEPQEKTIAEVLAMTQAPEYEVIVEGKINEVYNPTYGNMYIEDAAGNKLNIYGLYTEDNVRYDSMTTKPVAGDTIKVQSKVNIFNGSIELKNAVLLSHTPGTGSGDSGDSGDSGNTPVSGALATFEFPGKTGSSGHQDGNDLGTSASYTSGDYTLALTGMSKIYGPAQDATGVGCIKFGTSSKTGTLTFTVPENVNYVVIKVACYKTYGTKVTINGGAEQALSAKSNDGQYQEIVINTTTNKTVTIATVSSYARMMMSAVVFHATEPTA